MKILYLKNDQIDKTKWDDTINHSPQGRVYAYTWYLDCMSPSWDALVYEDYSAVFPLPWTENIPGIKRIFQPRVCQQLGLFLKSGMVEKILIHQFLNAIPAHFKSVDLQLNEGNPKPDLLDWKIIERTNMFLKIIDNYEAIESNYTENHRRNVKKSKGADLVAMDDMKVEQLVDNFLGEYKGKIRAYSDSQRQGLISLLNIALKKDAGLIRVWGDKMGRIFSAAFLLKSHNRIYYLLPFSTQKGREIGGMYKLIDALLWENVGKNMIFDFEGSSIEGIARFNKGFGAESITFYQISKENLPWWAKLILRLKKLISK